MNPVTVVQTSLGSPTEVQGRKNMTLGPFKDLGQLFPVVHFLKVHLFDRRPRHNQAVIVIILDILKSLVKTLHMLGRCIFRLMARHIEEIYIDLQGRIGQEA